LSDGSGPQKYGDKIEVEAGNVKFEGVIGGPDESD
jgi:hypothetical protein